MKKQMKKGFTLTELVIVIVIIAILAAVLIPTYTGLVQKARNNNDTSLVKMLNDALIIEEAENGQCANLTEVIAVEKEAGFLVTNLVANAKGNTLVWNQFTDRFYIYTEADGNIDVRDAAPDPTKFELNNDTVDLTGSTYLYSFWVLDTTINDTFSTYLTGTPTGSHVTGTGSYTINTTKGIDVGEQTSITEINYTNSANAQEVVIRTNGGTLNVGAAGNTAKGQVFHYGTLKDTTIYTEENCFHTYGAIGNMNLKEGKAIAEKNALIYLVTANMGVKIEEKDNGKFFIPAGTKQAENGTGVPVSVAAQVDISPVQEDVTLTYKDATKVGGNVYEIGNLSALEQFRDLVNSGFNFDGISVKLTADITLKDGWTPIGEGSRKAAINTEFGSEGWAYSGYVYKGEFDGGSHKIYNLNNKGYVPTTNCLGNDSTNLIYCYGFFSLVAGSANIHDIEFVNVDIDTSRYANEKDNVKGDCVAAAVGFSAGNVELKNIKVTGNSTIIGYSAVASIIGKSYNQDPAFSQNENYPSITVDNCESNAVVVCMSAHYAAGLVGDVNFSKFRECIITNNTFTGTVWTKANTSALNNAGIGIVDVDTTDHKNDFTHSGNVNSGVQKYGINGTPIANCLFVDMSTATAIESTRNSD